MEVLRFIKWQWGQIHRDTKQISLVIISAIISAIYCWFAGAGFFVSIVALIGTIVAMTIIVMWFEATINAWNKYRQVKEREAEEILRKLRGY